MNKCCTKCKVEYPATIEYFSPNREAKDGLASWCRKCSHIAIAAWWRRNKEKAYEQQKEYDKTFRGYIIHLVAMIKQRCTNKKCPDYENYGGRGIKCYFTSAELYGWLVDESIDPRGLQIHRIDNGGNYTLGNITFLVASEHIKLHNIRKRG